MPCKETECKCEATKTELIATGLGIFGHDEHGNCRNPTCGHPVLNHTDASAAGIQITVKPSADPNVLEEIQRYALLGKDLVSSDEVKSIKAVFEKVRDSRKEISEFKADEEISTGSMPFVIFEGSTRIGKTQTFWSVQHGSDIPHLYVPFAERGQTQTMHDGFFSHSNALKKCLEADIEELLTKPTSLDNPHQDFEVPSLRKTTGEFRTLGYLRGLLQSVSAAKTKTTDWLTTQARETYNYLGQKCSVDDMWKAGEFVIGFDEVQILSAAHLQLLRNLVRAAGGVAVMMGTSSSICNIISGGSDKMSRASLSVHFPWCHLITKYPPITRNSLLIRCPNLKLLDEKATNFVEHLISKHGKYGNRPGLVIVAVKQLLEENGPFEKRLRNMTDKVRRKFDNIYRRRYNDEKFIKNQRCLVTAAHSALDLDKETGKKRSREGEPLMCQHTMQSLIMHHFAHLERKSADGIWELHNKEDVHSRGGYSSSSSSSSSASSSSSGSTAASSSISSSSISSCCSSSSGLSEHGGTLYYLDEDKKEQRFAPKIVFASADDECLLYLLYADKPFGDSPVRDAYRISNQGISDKNSAVNSNDGQSLEACGSAAIMCSTQYNRNPEFQLSLSTFITNLANQLLPIRARASLTEEAFRIIDSFEDECIPYLMPANTHLCDFYQSCIPYLGNLYRTINKDMIDGRATLKVKMEKGSLKTLVKDHVAFTFEFKDWMDAIRMQEILDRVPMDSQVHIVVCNKVPHTTSAVRAGTLIRRVSIDVDAIDLLKIEGVEDPKVRHTLVLVFPFVEMNPFAEMSD